MNKKAPMTAYKILSTARWTHSQVPNLKYVPHAFTRQEAADRIHAADAKRFFAPIKTNTSQMIISTEENQPLKKVLVPICGINASIASTYYKGEYGIDRRVYTTDSEGKTTSHVVTDWYSTSGQLGACYYSQEGSYGMSLYAGSTYHDKPIEAALERHPLADKLQNFQAEKIADDVMIDGFEKRDAYVRDKANGRVYNAESSRAEKDIERHRYCDHVSIRSLAINASIDIKSNMLPVYIIQYPNCPIRVLSAISAQDETVHGPAPTSDVKVITTTAALATFFSLMLPPHVSIPARVLIVIFSSVSSGLVSHFKLAAQNALHENNIRRLSEQNEEVTATFADEQRLKATTNANGVEASPQAQRLDVDSKFYTILGLTPDAAVTEAIISQAVRDKILLVHPDKGGSTEAASEVLQARDLFICALRKKQAHDTTKRYFATYTKKAPTLVKDAIKQQPPRSVYYAKTNQLIQAVFAKDYKTAIMLIDKGGAHPDGHDAGENTLLTEAVKQQNSEAVLYALKNLRCSPDTSCDCPLHNTAMHYAASGAKGKVDLEIINLLITYGARINLINSRGETPLDMASDESVKKLLIARGALAHVTQAGAAGLLVQVRGFFGYSADQRTLLESKATKLLPEPQQKSPSIKQ
ncbi:MAG: ankyrin repeat domain-containing protein [Legionellales bacterium]